MERALVEAIRDISCECARKAERRDEKRHATETLLKGGNEDNSFLHTWLYGSG